MKKLLLFFLVIILFVVNSCKSGSNVNFISHNKQQIVDTVKADSTKSDYLAFKLSNSHCINLPVPKNFYFKESEAVSKDLNGNFLSKTIVFNDTLHNSTYEIKIYNPHNSKILLNNLKSGKYKTEKLDKFFIARRIDTISMNGKGMRLANPRIVYRVFISQQNCDTLYQVILNTSAIYFSQQKKSLDSAINKLLKH